FPRPGLEVEERFLKHVRRIGPPLQAAVQAQPHHAAQPVTVVFPDLPEHLRIGAALADHLDRVVGFAHAHKSVTTPGDGCNTRKMPFSAHSRAGGALVSAPAAIPSSALSFRMRRMASAAAAKKDGDQA